MPTICEDRMDWNGEYQFLVNSEACPPPPPGTTSPVTPVWMTLEVAYSEEWNFLSLPLVVESNLYSDLFPTAVPGTLYGFNGTYEQAQELIPGNGYWLRFYEAGIQTITGIAINERTISLSQGWNLIGGTSFETDVNDIIDPGNTDYPNGIIIPGSVYGFWDLYTGSEVLEPGKGYWINTYAAGEITIVHTGPPIIGPDYVSVDT